MYDVRSYKPSYPFDLIVEFARDLEVGVGKMNEVGGDLVEARVGRLPGIVLVRHPDLVKEVLVDRNADLTKARGLRLARVILGDGLLTSEVPVHTKQRKLILPAFHHSRLQSYGDTFVGRSVLEGDAWTEGERFDVAASMNRLALAIAGETLFGTDVLSQADAVSQAVHDAMAAFDAAQFPLADKLQWLPTHANRTSKRARASLDAVVYDMIEQRRHDLGDDLLSMLLEARDEDTGDGMTDLEVRDEAMTLLLAGHETTAVALAWTWALLAQHPEAEAALHHEVDALEGDPTFDDLRRLPVARQTFAEAMRLYPPAWTVGREAARDTTLGGHPVAKGTTVLFAPFHLHRDSRFWDEPEAFRPDRHVKGNGRHKFAYLPFSAGRRGCIGEQFAWSEATLVLATLARRWRLVLEGDVPDTQGSVTLRPASPLWMRAERRV
ncbi:cytochrome P450 [Rubrivirga sp.]|uniref:cytochrome P450 n=1 Tax=Rubrivirga sp. TaxID=1885344 RepID=UPI003C777922